jgi:hypothetical protein
VEEGGLDEQLLLLLSLDSFSSIHKMSKALKMEKIEKSYGEEIRLIFKSGFSGF